MIIRFIIHQLNKYCSDNNHKCFNIYVNAINAIKNSFKNERTVI
jgi:hypothetical protein